VGKIKAVEYSKLLYWNSHCRKRKYLTPWFGRGTKFHVQRLTTLSITVRTIGRSGRKTQNEFLNLDTWKRLEGYKSVSSKKLKQWIVIVDQTQLWLLKRRLFY
jgi:hypothetical protein